MREVVEEINHEFEIEKFTLADRVRTRGVATQPAQTQPIAPSKQDTAALERYSAAVFERTQP